MNSLPKEVWIIGSGQMAQAYMKVLSSLDIDFKVIGRSDRTKSKIKEDFGKDLISGGLSNFLASNPDIVSHAIVAVSVDNLEKTGNLLMNYGVINILLEKPGALDYEGIKRVSDHAKASESKVFIGYNRRFYAPIIALDKLLIESKPVSVNFEFTEWGHRIAELDRLPEALNNWLLANSTHVIDLAFYLSGAPTSMTSFVSGNLDWTTLKANYAGAGVSNRGILFNYFAGWASPGRWSVEVLTNDFKYILRPMEKLQVQKLGTVTMADVPDIDYAVDEEFKPGLFEQTKTFLTNLEDERLVDIEHHAEMSKNIYKLIEQGGSLSNE